MSKNISNSNFNSQRKLTTSHGNYHFYDINTLDEIGLINIDKTPYSIRVLLENVLRIMLN